MPPIRPIFSTLGLCLVFILILLLPVQAGASLAPQATPTPAPVIVEEPTISPPYKEMCQDGWYRYTNNRSHLAYLTLNTKDPNLSANQGEWRPDLPQDGYYLVEAYIPAHEAANIACPDWSATQDSGDAPYTVHHAYGETKLSRSQDPVRDDWISLSEFGFLKGTTGWVQINDLNGEDTLTRTISMSALRFTWVRPLDRFTIYLPAIVKHGAPTLAVTSVWTADASSAALSAFTPGAMVRIYATGTNTLEDNAQVTLNWKATGPCGSSTLASVPLTLPRGGWTQQIQTTAPSCPGMHTVTAELVSRGGASSRSALYVINQPSLVTLTTRQAFDKCNAPTPTQMETWWKSSPYYTINLYIGGISMGCDNLNLDAFWVHQVSQQGWGFIPTWVGPQAPCSKFRYKFSSDPAKAYSEGRAEADAARQALYKLGLQGAGIIYYDLESYSGATTSCRTASQNFLKGWTERLHELGLRAGGYGSACTSYVSDWAATNPAVDDVWLAAWKYEFYNANATVWDVSCISNSLWPNHQRLRQYAGDHVETWGGVAMTIDSNATDGEITNFPAPTPTLSAVQADNSAAETQPGAALVADRITTGWWSSEQGWLQLGPQLYITGDAGRSWQARPVPGNLALVQFASPAIAWAVTRDPVTQAEKFSYTHDGGLSWLTAPVQPAAGKEGWRPRSLAVIDAQTAFYVRQAQSSRSFSLGELLRTRDGGRTWQRFDLPAAGEIVFQDALNGVLTGGIDGEQVFTTADGGETWTEVNATERHGFPLSPLSPLASLPDNTAQLQALDAQVAFALAVPGQCSGEKSADKPLTCRQAPALYRSRDGGKTWEMISLPDSW